MNRVQKVRVALFVIAALSTWMIYPAVARWSWGAPQKKMSFAEYLNSGAEESWVELEGVFVDHTNRVDTEMVRKGQSQGYAGTYFPLRTGRDDGKRVKVFLKPKSYTSNEGVVVLMKEGESGDQLSGRASSFPRDGLQVVRGARLRGSEFPDDLRSALASCSLGTDAPIILLEQDLKPPSTGGALGLLAIPFGCLALFAATFALAKKPFPPAPAPDNSGQPPEVRG